MARRVIDLLHTLADAGEEDTFLRSLYPGYDYATQRSCASTDRRTSKDAAVIRAMTAVLRAREIGVIWSPRRSASAPLPPPAPPILSTLRGGPLDVARMRRNTDRLDAYAHELAAWGRTTERVLETRVAAADAAASMKESEARIAQAEASIADAELSREQTELGFTLLHETVSDRRALMRAATTIHALPGGKK